MKGNHIALWKAPQYKYLFLNFLMKTAPLDDNCPFAEAKLRAQLLLQSEPLGKERAGAVVRDAIHNAAFIQALILPLGLYGTTAGVFHKLSQFPRQNCCEEVCFLTEAWEPRVIFRKYRRAFIHLPLSFSFPLPRPWLWVDDNAICLTMMGKGIWGWGDLSGGWNVLTLDHGDGCEWIY